MSKSRISIIKALGDELPGVAQRLQEQVTLPLAGAIVVGIFLLWVSDNSHTQCEALNRMVADPLRSFGIVPLVSDISFILPPTVRVSRSIALADQYLAQSILGVGWRPASGH